MGKERIAKLKKEIEMLEQQENCQHDYHYIGRFLTHGEEVTMVQWESKYYCAKCLNIKWIPDEEPRYSKIFVGPTAAQIGLMDL